VGRQMLEVVQDMYERGRKDSNVRFFCTSSVLSDCIAPRQTVNHEFRS
jgi:hypothetical protein